MTSGLTPWARRGLTAEAAARMRPRGPKSRRQAAFSFRLGPEPTRKAARAGRRPLSSMRSGRARSRPAFMARFSRKAGPVWARVRSMTARRMTSCRTYSLKAA